MPMIGVASGAMIIAPITVAVESVRTPPAAMTDDSVSMVQNAERLDGVSPDDRSRSCASSFSVRRWAAGRTRARTPLSIPPRNHDRCDPDLQDTVYVINPGQYGRRSVVDRGVGVDQIGRLL